MKLNAHRRFIGGSKRIIFTSPVLHLTFGFYKAWSPAPRLSWYVNKITNTSSAVIITCCHLQDLTNVIVIFTYSSFITPISHLIDRLRLANLTNDQFQMAANDGPTGEASSPRASFSSIREGAPPAEDGARPTIDYISNVIDGLLQAPLVRRPIELDAGSGARPLDTEREILASMLGQHSTGRNLSKKDLPSGLKPRIGIEVPAELAERHSRFMPELGNSTPRGTADVVEPEAYFASSPPPSFPPLQANPTPEGQFSSAGPMMRHDRSFSPPETGVLSVMLGRPLPPIPEFSHREEPIRTETIRPKTSAETSDAPFSTLQTYPNLDDEYGSDSEAEIHPAFRRRMNNAPLRLFRGASTILNAGTYDEVVRQSVARPSSSHDVQPAPSALDRPQHNHPWPSPRRHHYSRSTSDLASRNASDFPPRQTSLTHQTDLLVQPRLDSNSLGIYLTDSLHDPIDPNIPPPQSLSRNRHSIQIPSSTGFNDLLAAQTSAPIAQDMSPIIGSSSALNRSYSTQDRRLTHNEGVSQFNREHFQSLGTSRTPPVRSTPLFSHPILYPYPFPWQRFPASPGAYPPPPLTQQEKDDAASTKAEPDSMNHDAAIAQLFQPSAVDRIEAVLGMTAPAAATQLRSETLPSVVRERISRDFIDDRERAMRRVSGGVKRVSLCLLLFSYFDIRGRWRKEKKKKNL